jgi:hypothetical protein
MAATVVSIQADSRSWQRIRRARKHGRGWASSLDDETRRNAYNDGTPWLDDDVGAVINMLSTQPIPSTFEMAMSLGRTLYSTQSARAHVRFCLSHPAVFKQALTLLEDPSSSGGLQACWLDSTTTAK